MVVVGATERDNDEGAGEHERPQQPRVAGINARPEEMPAPQPPRSGHRWSLPGPAHPRRPDLAVGNWGRRLVWRTQCPSSSEGREGGRGRRRGARAAGERRRRAAARRPWRRARGERESRERDKSARVTLGTKKREP